MRLALAARQDEDEHPSDTVHDASSGASGAEAGGGGLAGHRVHKVGQEDHCRSPFRFRLPYTFIIARPRRLSRELSEFF